MGTDHLSVARRSRREDKGSVLKGVNLMFRFLYQLFLTFNATSLIIVIFFIKMQLQFLSGLPGWISYIAYICIPIILTKISLLAASFLSSDSIEGDIVGVEIANNAFLPSYLGYFFVALSVPYGETLLFVFLILYIFTYFSQTLYFNPLFLLWGYHFYYITTKNNIRIFLISKKVIRGTAGLNFNYLKRINDFTYIDVEKFQQSGI